MANERFDETIYRLVEKDDAAAGAAEIKARIDSEPEFAAAFDRTRKTVLSLQGLAPKPADRAVGSFTQRDFDRLTRGVLKGYQSKLGGLYVALGKAYLHQTPESYVSFLGRETDAKEEEISPRLRKATESYVALGGRTGTTDFDEEFAALDPLAKSMRCLVVGKALTPRVHSLWFTEGMVSLKARDFDHAKRSFEMAGDLASSRSEQVASIEGRSLVSYFKEDFLEQAQLLKTSLGIDPQSTVGTNNMAMALLNLGQIDRAVAILEGLYSRAGSEPKVRRDCIKALSVAKHWRFFRGHSELFDRFLYAARVHLGTGACDSIVRVGL